MQVNPWHIKNGFTMVLQNCIKLRVFVPGFCILKIRPQIIRNVAQCHFNPQILSLSLSFLYISLSLSICFAIFLHRPISFSLLLRPADSLSLFSFPFALFLYLSLLPSACLFLILCSISLKYGHACPIPQTLKLSS